MTDHLTNPRNGITERMIILLTAAIALLCLALGSRWALLGWGVLAFTGAALVATGFVLTHRLVPDTFPHVLTRAHVAELAETIAANSPGAVRAAKRRGGTKGLSSITRHYPDKLHALACLVPRPTDPRRANG